MYLRGQTDSRAGREEKKRPKRPKTTKKTRLPGLGTTSPPIPIPDQPLLDFILLLFPPLSHPSPSIHVLHLTSVDPVVHHSRLRCSQRPSHPPSRPLRRKVGGGKEAFLRPLVFVDGDLDCKRPPRLDSSVRQLVSLSRPLPSSLNPATGQSRPCRPFTSGRPLLSPLGSRPQFLALLLWVR